jgi:hypothetical protein
MAEGNGSHIPTRSRAGDSGNDELAQQVLRYLSGEESAETVAALGVKLASDPTARDLFVRLCLLDSWLSEKFAPGRREFMSEMMLDEVDERGGASSLDAMVMPAIMADEDLDEEPEPITVPTWPAVPPEPLAWYRRRLTWAAAAVLVIAFGAMSVISRMTAPVVEQPIVATLMGVQDAQWLKADPSLVPGALLKASTQLRLESGLVRLTFRTGAKVVVEGPAVFTPDADGNLTLARGRLTALVPPSGKGFTVKTPTAKVVDLGTEFGVDVPATRGDAVEIQVFEGLVTLAPAAKVAANSSAQPQLLREGTGAKVDTAGAITPVPANPALFVRNADADALERANSGSGFDRWLAHRVEMARNPDVIAYYPFDTDNKIKNPDRLSNASPAGTVLDGTLSGDAGALPQWAAGRWPQKSALSFDVRNFPRVTIPASDAMDFSRGPVVGESQPFTVAVWVKAKSKPVPGVSIVALGSVGALETESTFYRYILRDGTPGANGKRSILNSNNFVSARWHFVVGTYDSANGAMRLYIDGKVMNDAAPGAGTAPRILPAAAGPVVLGCRAQPSGSFMMPLDGAIDELVFFRRALTAEEVSKLYDAGKPD